MAQDWARTIMVGDILFLLTKGIEVNDEAQTTKPCIICEYRLNAIPRILYWTYETDLVRDNYFDLIDIEDLRELLLEDLN